MLTLARNALAVLTMASTLACSRAMMTGNAEADEAAIRALDRQMLQAVTAKDVAATAAFYAADARLMAPNVPTASSQPA